MNNRKELKENNRKELKEICEYLEPYSGNWDKPYRCTKDDYCKEKIILQDMPFCSYSIKSNQKTNRNSNSR